MGRVGLAALLVAVIVGGLGACEPRAEQTTGDEPPHEEVGAPGAGAAEADGAERDEGDEGDESAAGEAKEETPDNILEVTADGDQVSGGGAGDEPTGHVQEAELRDLPGGVVDGDTLKAVGFPDSLRLLHIDTEETLHKKVNRKRAREDWEAYLEEQTSEDDFATFGTPMGDRAREFARDFFEGVDKIWVEYESPGRTKGFFGRHLAYVWIRDQGEWKNYNVEAVRAGMSPYHTKYGYSERYHDEMVEAQREAREHERGIWAPDAKSYPDYDERLAHFEKRADQIATFRERFEDDPRYVDLAADTAYADLRDRLGRRMVVFGEVGSFAETTNPERIRMRYRYQRDFLVVAFEPVEITDHDVDVEDEDYIYVEGVVGMYRGDPQLRFDDESWVRSGTKPPEE